MNWKKWLGKQVRGGGGCWVSRAVGLVQGCGKAGGCAAPAADNKQSAGSWISRVLMQGAKQVSTQNTQAAKLLDEVMAKLDAAVQAEGNSSQTGGATSGEAQSAAPGRALLDAIDREMAARPLQTVVGRVRQSEVVDQFRRELETQSLTVTTVTSFLQLLQQVLPMLLVR